MFLCIVECNRCSAVGGIIFIVKNADIAVVYKFLISFNVYKAICVMSFFGIIGFFIKGQEIINIFVRNIFIFGANINSFNMRINIF